jgi:predicted regulator of Ras-like GTPase activity (Roadblock/LC7/MglB family)
VQGSEEPAKIDPFKQALEEYLRIPGVKAAILVSDQGLKISGAAQEQVDEAGLAALVIDAARAAECLGLQVQAGRLDTMTIEFETLTVVLAPFTPDVMLALVAVPGSLATMRCAPSDGHASPPTLASVRESAQPPDQA